MKKGSFSLKRFLSEAGPGRAIQYVQKKQILFQQGKRGNAVFYILEGIIALTVLSEGKIKIVSLVGRGSFAGKECMASTRPPSTASARTLTNCTVLRIDRNEILRVIEGEKIFAALFLDYLLGAVSRYQEVIMEHLFDSAEKRLARILLMLANFGHNGKFEAVIPYIGQDDLAEVVGTTRSRTSSFMNNFRSLGLIAYRKQGPMTIRTDRLSDWLTAQPALIPSLRPQKVVAR